MLAVRLKEGRKGGREEEGRKERRESAVGCVDEASERRKTIGDE